VKEMTLPKPAKQSPWLSTREIATRLDVHDETVRAWIRRGLQTGNGNGVVRLRCVRIGGRYRVRRKWLRECLEHLKVEASGQPEPLPVEPVDRQRERFEREKQAVLKRLGRR
jgi:transposase